MTPLYSLHKDDITSSILFLVEERVDEDSSTCQETLLLGSGILWEVNLKSIGGGQYFNQDTLWLFENQSFILLTALIAHFSIVNSERLSTAALATGITLCATIDAYSSETSGRMKQVKVVVAIIVHLEGRYTIEGISL